MTGAFDPEKLRSAREAKGWSRTRLAAATDRSMHTITSWETGLRAPNPENVRLLATALGVPAEALWSPGITGLRDLRVQAGLIQRQVAKLTGISQERLRHLETGANRLQGNDSEQLAKVYGVSQADIVSAWEVNRRLLVAPPNEQESQ